MNIARWNEGARKKVMMKKKFFCRNMLAKIFRQSIAAK
jgi:hypothetical protein